MTAIELITRIKEDLASLEALVIENTVSIDNSLKEFELHKEHKIGKLGLIKGIPCRVTVQKGCNNCLIGVKCSGLYRCISRDRIDNTGIIFKAL